MNLRFCIPYSKNKKLLEAYEYEFSLCKSDEDWICFLDGDTAFLTADFGHQIQEYIDLYPDTGLFTSYASRCHYVRQVLKNTDMANPNIIYHKNMAEYAKTKLHGKIKPIDKRIAGHLLLMKKKTWKIILPEVNRTAAAKNILGVDTKISNAVLKHGLTIRLMRGIYLFHYLRLQEGFGSKKHLL